MYVACSILIHLYLLLLQPFLGDLCKIITTGEADAVTVEVLGILGNLSMDIDFHKLITEMNLLPFVLQQLKVSCLV